MDSTVYKKIESYLMEIIAQNANIPEYKLPSERALSLAFDASRKPVRRAYDRLIQKGYVTNIHGKGYFINTQNQENMPFPAPMTNPKICLILPSIQTQFDHNILAGIHQFCSSHQVELAIHVSNTSAETESQLLRSVPLSGVKGIILFPVEHDAYQPELLQLSLRKYPLVLLDRTIKNIHASFISSQNHEAMVNAVEFLKKKGFQNLVFITPPSGESSTGDERINGFTHGLLRHYKMATPQNLLIIEGSQAQATNTVLKHLQKYPDIEAIIVGCVHRQPVLQAIEKIGKDAAKNIKLMFFDDELSLFERANLKPYILQQDGYQMGYLAAESLYNQIYGDLRTVTKLLPVTIIDTGVPDANPCWEG